MEFNKPANKAFRFFYTDSNNAHMKLKLKYLKYTGLRFYSCDGIEDD